MLALEADAIQRAANGPRTWAVQRPALAHALRARPSITTEQVAAIRSVTMTDAPVAVIVGHAGTGKTFALDAARAAWTETGLRCRGVALAARAARELEAGSGIPSQTIASLLHDLDRGTLRLGPKDVLVVDEAGMVGTRHLHRLIDATTTAGAKLVLVGDPKQLAEIDAGGLFASLARRLGHAELTENRRLNDPAQHATARALRHGEIHDALRRMQRAGNLTLDLNADRLRDRMTLDWYAERSTGRHVVMLALHRHDVTDLNHRARAQLLANGDLGPAVLDRRRASSCASATRSSPSATTDASASSTAPKAPSSAARTVKSRSRPATAPASRAARVHRRRTPHPRLRHDHPQEPRHDV